MKKRLLKIIFSVATFIIVLGVLGVIIEHWVNTLPEEPPVLFTGEAGNAFSKYFNLIQKIISYPFYFLCCVLYGFLAKKYGTIYELPFTTLLFVGGFLSGLPSLFLSHFIAYVVEIFIYGFFNIDITLRILWLLHPLFVISVSVFIGILIFTVLIEKTVNTNEK